MTRAPARPAPSQRTARPARAAAPAEAPRRDPRSGTRAVPPQPGFAALVRVECQPRGRRYVRAGRHGQRSCPGQRNDIFIALLLNSVQRGSRTFRRDVIFQAPPIGSRGGRLPSRRHAVLWLTSHIRIGYPIHHFRGRKPTTRIEMQRFGAVAVALRWCDCPIPGLRRGQEGQCRCRERPRSTARAGNQ